MTVGEVLRASRALIEEPSRWTQGAFNKNADGIPYVEGDDAVCWCAEGAIWHVGIDDYAALGDALTLLEFVIDGQIPTWNDMPDRAHAEVLAAFDRAIALAGGAG